MLQRDKGSINKCEAGRVDMITGIKLRSHKNDVLSIEVKDDELLATVAIIDDQNFIVAQVQVDLQELYDDIEKLYNGQ